MIYMETGSTDPAYNLAFEEYILNHRLKGDHLLLWQNDNAVIIGQNQNTSEEINETFVREHGIKVVRRMTGGGAVYHDLGNLNYSFITDWHEDADVSIGRFTEAVVAALRSLGLDAKASGRNDILVDGKKISGTAQRISGNRILYHGTLLFDSDPEMIAGALNADPAKFISKSTKSVRSRVGGIRAALKEGPYETIGLQEFWVLIREMLGTASGPENTLIEEYVTPEEETEIRKLCEEKYDRWEWNYGRSPHFSYRNKKRFPGGTLEVGLNVEKGLITGAGIYGDFLSLKPTEELTGFLIGEPYEKEHIQNILKENFCPDRPDSSGGDSLRQYLGSITMEELLETMFG